ncbi:hypothetical protein [Flavobacterium sp.]|uniref:hypothetical protein n=1 Tax=Flavobacterium sp. TaxID=239 RepID=UPI0033429D9D
MKKIITVLIILISTYSFCQEKETFSFVKTSSGDVKISGIWEQLNTVDDSGQTYLKNKEGVIIAVAQNPKNAYSFFKSTASNFVNVKLFYKWDSDFRKENNFKTDKIKENSKDEYIIWKYNDGKYDNVFLFGSSKNTFLNILVYTSIWNEEEKILFLENVYKTNKL